MSVPLYIATNNGDIGGGEVMLLNLARAARKLGHRVTVIGPSQPGQLLEAAADEGFSRVSLPARSRSQYAAQLRAWDRRHRRGLLWCNGLLPAVATSGHRQRIVHLHQLPTGKLQQLLARVARQGALLTLLPSQFAADFFAGSRVFYNWVEPPALPVTKRELKQPIRVGFIGRVSSIKGSDLAADAVRELNAACPGRFTLVLAGTAKFIDPAHSLSMEDSLGSLGRHLELLGCVEPAELLSQVDLLLVPSLVPETFGLVAAEAMSARVPLIVSDAGALPEVVGHKHPWIVERGNLTALLAMIDRLATLLVEQPEQVDRVVLQAFWRWQEYFSPQAGQQRVQEILEELR